MTPWVEYEYLDKEGNSHNIRTMVPGNVAYFRESLTVALKREDCVLTSFCILPIGSTSGCSPEVSYDTAYEAKYSPDLSYDTVEVTTLDSRTRTYIPARASGKSISDLDGKLTELVKELETHPITVDTIQKSISQFAKGLSKEDNSLFRIINSISEGEKFKVDNFEYSIDSNNLITIKCEKEECLTNKSILKSLYIMKSFLEKEQTFQPTKCTQIICKITPLAKANLVNAGKRLRMYGKKPPFVPRFDEQLNPLPDEIKFETEKGVLLKVVDPEKYGDYYFELKMVLTPPDYLNKDFDSSLWDLPF